MEGDSVQAALKHVALDPKFYLDRQRIRDVPVSCICSWTWGRPVLRWVRTSTVLGCPWHSQSPWIDVRQL